MSRLIDLLYSFEASDVKSDVRLHDWFLVLLFDLVWQDVGDLLDPNYLETFKTGGRERERERERERLKRVHTVSVLILGDASRAHRLLHDKVEYSTVLMLSMLSIA